MPRPNTMSFSAVIFDLDGTLLDTLQDIADSANRVLAAAGLPVHDVRAYRYYVGDGIGQLIERIVPPDLPDRVATMARIADAYRQDYGRNWNVATRPYPGVPELLDELSARGVKMAVLSNKPHEFTVRCVTAQLGRWRFEQVLGADDSLPRKPDPTGALRIAARCGVPPGEFLYVGDTATDMQTARNAGMAAVGVLWGFRDRRELESAGAWRIVERPEEVVALMR